MRVVLGAFALVPLFAAMAQAEDVKIKDITIAIEPMTFYSGERNRYPEWGSRMDCPTYHDQPAGSKDRWIQNLCGARANQKPVVKQIGASNPGNNCGYARYAVACIKVQ